MEMLHGSELAAIDSERDIQPAQAGQVSTCAMEWRVLRMIAEGNLVAVHIRMTLCLLIARLAVVR